MEHGSSDSARQDVEATGVTFPTLIDDRGATSAGFGFKVVPNGVLVDANGIVRYLKIGGFAIDNVSDVAAVERFSQGGDPGPSAEATVLYELDPLTRELVETKLRLGHQLAALGRLDEAVAEWEDALHRDPENLAIRKQIWSTLHPEKFHPTIDSGWQKEQLARERAEEIAAGFCGPDGCPLPWVTAEAARP
jgi:hypothetical protein